MLPIEFEGEKLDIGFNAQYLLDFLGACGSDSVSISIKDSETQGLLRPVGGEDLEYRYVAMPMNV
jgi:DNA polymerase-3 subunit beta